MTNAVVTAETVKGWLDEMREPMMEVVGRELDVVRMLRVATTTIRSTPDLLRCSRASLCACVLESSQLGLELDSVLGHAYIVPYKQTATLIPGYKGLLKLARQSGEISKVEARPVYKGDAFTYHFGIEPKLEHVPCGDTDPEKITHVYAIAWLTNGEKQFDVMTRGEVDAIRQRSKASSRGPWVTDYTPMALKTVLRRLCKLLPASVELQRAVSLDELADVGKQHLKEVSVTVEDAEPDPLAAGKHSGKQTKTTVAPEPVAPPSASSEPPPAGDASTDEAPQEWPIAARARAELKPIVETIALLIPGDATQSERDKIVARVWKAITTDPDFEGCASYAEAVQLVEARLDEEKPINFLAKWLERAKITVDEYRDAIKEQQQEMGA